MAGNRTARFLERFVKLSPDQVKEHFGEYLAEGKDSIEPDELIKKLRDTGSMRAAQSLLSRLEKEKNLALVKVMAVEKKAEQQVTKEADKIVETVDSVVVA